ncbi:hypothetical protein K523DRAFT_359653 [Schizophyllum commune Tattone D]|nr:hypothetical protein K523DRAFT_359653 [Schizophyllum commune Tattone D]
MDAWSTIRMGPPPMGFQPVNRPPPPVVFPMANGPVVPTFPNMPSPAAPVPYNPLSPQWIEERTALANKVLWIDPMRSVSMYPTWNGKRHPVTFAAPPHISEILSRYPPQYQADAYARFIMEGLPTPPFTDAHIAENDRLLAKNIGLIAHCTAQIPSMSKPLMMNPMPPNAPALRDMVQKVTLLRNSLMTENNIRSWLKFRINSLPPEVLADIFSYVVWSPGATIDIIRNRASISQVCRLWRGIATTDVTLWNSLRVIDDYPWRLTEQHIVRSGDGFIDIRIDEDERIRQGKPPLRGKVWESLIDLICTKLSQIRSFIVSHGDVEGMIYITEKMQAAAMGIPMRMERLEMHLSGNDMPGAVDLTNCKSVPLFGGRNVESLTWLTLKGIPVNWPQSIASNLTTFDIRRIPYERSLPLQRFREILTASPHLEKLILDGAGPIMPIPSWSDADVTPIPLPKLRMLSLGDQSIQYAVFIWRLLHAPNLKELILLNLFGDDYTPFIELLIGQMPDLRSLTWYSVEVWPSPQTRIVMRRWFNSMPKLRYLNLSGVRHALIDLFVMEGGVAPGEIPGPEPVLPFLLAVEWENIEPDDIAYLVKRRREQGRPLRKLYVRQDWWEKLKAAPNASTNLMGLQREAHNILMFVPPMSDKTPEEKEALEDVVDVAMDLS